MHPEQKITYMADGESHKASVFVSTTRFILPSSMTVHSSQKWETFVSYTENDESLPLFDDFPSSIHEFSPVYCPAHLLGSNRDSQHEYAVSQLKNRGYRIVRERDNIEEWNKRLQGIPSLDLFNLFTSEEWMRIEYLGYLRDQGKI